MKWLKEVINDVNDKDLGAIVRCRYNYETYGQEPAETEAQVVQFVFKTFVKKEIDHHKEVSVKRSQVAKKGGGRPKKEVK